MLRPLLRTNAALVCAAALLAPMLLRASARAGEVYHCYFGNTHSHTSYSDGAKSTPAEHFSQARDAGFDFYAVTDHALKKYVRFTRESYEATKQEANRFTTDTFVAMTGFEFSENDGPGGKGHLTVLNAAEYLDATGPNVYLPMLYDWLIRDQKTPVAAGFNHPGPTSYDSFGYLTDSRRDAVTMYEMINSGKLRYEGFLAALAKGWRVAPIAGQDGHGTWRITKNDYRTGVLATGLTRDNLIQAMRARRVYCTWDRNLNVSFSANGSMMGSVIKKPASLDFRINVYDPDVTDPEERITKVEIAGENGVTVASKEFSSHSATWANTIEPKGKYYFLKVYCGDKTDGPTAYSAPIWIEH